MKFDDQAPYQVPRDQSRWRSLGMACAIHAGLFLFLWIGVHWQSSEPVAVEAEVWDMKTQAAAPPPPPTPEPEPAPEPAPAPVAPPAPAAPPAPVVEMPVAPKEPDIALERRLARQKAEKQAGEEQRALRQQEREKAALKAKQEQAEEKAKDKAEAKAKAARDAQAKAKAEAEQDKLEEKKLAEKKLADKKRDDKKLEDKKLADTKQAKAKQAAQEQKAQEKERDATMRRLNAAAGSGSTGSTGTAAKSTSPGRDSGYAAAVTSKIKSNIAYSGSSAVAGNPRALYKIEQLPTGEIISVKKIQSSGIAAYDSAVENAIAKSSPLPKKKDGTVDREINAGFNMKDSP
jgi:colicin import membrane protein